MKYIFDFDDVLFNNTKQFKEHMYACLEKAGVSRGKAEEYYNTVRENRFSLKAFIKTLFAFWGIKKEAEEVYADIMRECPNFLNNELIEAVKRVGVENCYIVTYGNEEFQKDKVKYSGIGNLFHEDKIIPVTKGKKETVEKICARNMGQQVVFIDDKEKFIKEPGLAEIPNLTVIHYKDNLRELIKKIRDKDPGSELRKK